MKQVDISAPGMDEQRDFMRASAKKKEGQRFPLPPQIFHGEKYCGDYDDFDVANEDDELEEFLNIPRKTPKAVKPGEEEEKKPEEGEEKAAASEEAATPAGDEAAKDEPQEEAAQEAAEETEESEET